MKYSKYPVQPLRMDDEPRRKRRKAADRSRYADEKDGKVFF